jgi:predicted transcriptional regulator
MDIDLLTAKAKWAVLEKIAKSEVSPLEIASQLNTSAANISTQLRYLELADIVKKRRVSNAQAGKPRILYSLKKNILLVMAASEKLHMRQIVELDEQKEIILRIWQLPKSI